MASEESGFLVEERLEVYAIVEEALRKGVQVMVRGYRPSNPEKTVLQASLRPAFRQLV